MTCTVTRKITQHPARDATTLAIVITALAVFLCGTSIGILAALRGVAGVTSADEHDRELWFVTGAPSGRSLMEAVAVVVDDLAERAQAEVLGW